MEKKENRSINVLKGIACLLVVINHYHGTGTIGDILYCISHFGVPVFFLVSGYFLYSSKGDIAEKIPRKLKHIGKLIILHISLCVLDFVCQKIFLAGNAIRKDVVVKDLLSYFSLGAFKTTLLWSQSVFGTGQWFLIALFEAYIVFYMLYKLRLGKVIEKYGPWIAMLLLAIHIIGRDLIVLSGQKLFLGVNINESYSVRNVWFDAIPFMLIGLNLRTRQEKQAKKDRYSVMLLCISVIALGASIGESYLIEKHITLNNVLYIGTVVSVVLAFYFATNNPEILANSWIGEKLEYTGKHLSMIAYFIHVLVGHYIEHFIKNGGGGAQILHDLTPLFVIIATLLLSWIIYKTNLALSKNPKYSLAYLMSFALCISFLALPSGTEWKMLYKATENATEIKITDRFHTSYQSTVLVTAQNISGVTIDAIEIPVQQFIGGGIKQYSLINDEEYSYEVIFNENSNVSIRKTDNISQVRVWAK